MQKLLLDEEYLYHGFWKYISENNYKCSYCGHQSALQLPLCPACTARMDE